MGTLCCLHPTTPEIVWDAVTNLFEQVFVSIEISLTGHRGWHTIMGHVEKFVASWFFETVRGRSVPIDGFQARVFRDVLTFQDHTVGRPAR